MRTAGSVLLSSVLLMLCACSTAFEPPGSAERRELAPSGTLRFGVVAAVARTEFFVVTKTDGEPEGVTVDLARELARRLGVPVKFTLARSSTELTELLIGGKLDAAIMPPDGQRWERLDFASYYFVDQNTYMVPAGSRFKTIADVDRPGARVLAIGGTATSRAATSHIKRSWVTPVDSIDEALEMLRTGEADAFALSQASLDALVPQVPGSRILDGAINRLGFAFAIPKNRPNGLFYLTSFTEEAKLSGIVQRAFDNAGLYKSKVAPRNEQYPVTLRPKTPSFDPQDYLAR